MNVVMECPHTHTHGTVEQTRPLCQTGLLQEGATLSLVHCWSGEDIPEITGRAQQLQGVTKGEAAVNKTHRLSSSVPKTESNL